MTIMNQIINNRTTYVHSIFDKNPTTAMVHGNRQFINYKLQQMITITRVSSVSHVLNQRMV